MTRKFSPSSLALLKECPRCFWLRFNRGIRRPNSIFPSLPSGMDRILKEHFDRFMQEHKLPPELKDLEGVELFDDLELMAVWRNNFRGIQWTDEEGNLFRGAIDNILKKDGKLIVLDYKTRGYPLKEDTHTHYEDQMHIYNFLLRKNGYETEEYAYLLFYHPDTVNEKGDVIFNTNLVRIDVNVDRAAEIFKTAVELLRQDMPPPATDCEFCRWHEERF